MKNSLTLGVLALVAAAAFSASAHTHAADHAALKKAAGLEQVIHDEAAPALQAQNLRSLHELTAEAPSTLQRAAFTAFAAFERMTALLEQAAHAASISTSDNKASYLNYAPQALPYGPNNSNSNGQWWALSGQPTKTFHRLVVRDSSGCVIALGHGASPNQVVDLYVGGSGGTSTHETVYPFGLSYMGSSSCIWWKKISCEPNSGEQVINFIY